MKIKFIYVLGGLLFVLLLFQSHLTGVGTNISADSTGSPLSTTSCMSCHGGVNPSNSTVRIRMLNNSGVAISNYIPGTQYTLEISLQNQTGLAYGFQATIFDNTNAQAGVFNPAVGVNTKVVSINGRSYIENGSNPNLPPVSYTIEWTAPSAGAGDVRVYAAAVIADLPYGIGGDYTLPTANLRLREYKPTSIDYQNTRYCSADSIAIVSLTGMSGGSFSSTPTGLVMNSSTGEVDLINSIPGQTYTITYQVSGVTASDVIDVETSFEAKFEVGDTTYCINSGVNPILTIMGTTPGAYSSTPAGLAFVSTATGEIDLSNSSTGVYTVSYRSYGICPGKDTITVTTSVCSDLNKIDDNNINIVYPNPSQGTVIIESSVGFNRIILRNLWGRVVFTKTYSNKGFSYKNV